MIKVRFVPCAEYINGEEFPIDYYLYDINDNIKDGHVSDTWYIDGELPAIPHVGDEIFMWYIEDAYEQSKAVFEKQAKCKHDQIGVKTCFWKMIKGWRDANIEWIGDVSVEDALYKYFKSREAEGFRHNTWSVKRILYMANDEYVYIIIEH